VGIEINGKKLHEIELYQEPYNPGTVVRLRYPKSQIRYNLEQGNEFIDVPAFLAIELYRSCILSQEQDSLVVVNENGKHIGDFFIERVIYPNSLENRVQFILKKQF